MKQRTIRLWFGWLFTLVFFMLNAGSAFGQGGVLEDSTLGIFSVEDLVKIRKVLAKERESLMQDQEKIRDRGVEVTREFLGKTSEENSNQDKILIRVAEYYIEEEMLEFEQRFDAYEEEYTGYEQQLKQFEQGVLKVEPREPPLPQRNYQKAISIYDLIIRNFPESDLVDDSYYNKAYLLQEMEERETAQQIFQTIIDEYPESDYAPEAYMKLAESFFYPEEGDDKARTILKLNKAIQLYKNVLQYKDSPRYDEALYKLGWSYYRLAGEDPDYYTDAIIYFLGVVRDIEDLEDSDPTGELVQANVKPEALEFIAASFIDPSYQRNGVANAKQFLEKLGKPGYGIEIMENMGDRYAKIGNWQEAIDSYDELLGMYPAYHFAPRVQKKIADAYIADRQFERAFNERRYLFENYNPKSDWYAQLELREIPDRITALDEAYRITEEAFRTNIQYLYNIAQEKEANEESALTEYQEFVELCKRYLDNYPTDENAYEINWALAYVLDTRLRRFDEAFAEYIRVSNDYLETGHQLDAAVNAINAADTLVNMSRVMADPTQLGSGLTNQQLKTLSQEEKLLGEAYDNFIKLFPNSPETPSVLAAAGALYYEHRQYELAKKYYKTMVTKFPKAQQKSVGLISLMNSYFFLGQYRDAEIVAKKILVTAEIPEEQVVIARSRIGESIFKNGEKLEQEGRYLEAAKEYRRVHEEASEYVTFVDVSLFRSARNFEQAGEWQKAIQTYEILVEDYPQSDQVLTALNNMAADYKEMEDYVNVAQTNERIFTRFAGTPEAENALFNASLFYSKAEAWGEAIRANNTYIATYPTNPESKDLLFENAKFYLKLDDLNNANRIYEEFALQYPNDPLTIEAYYNRGNFYYERSKTDSAKVEFNKAIARSNDFARAGRDPNLYYAAESNYKLGQILYDEYKAIELTYPQNTLRAQLQRKQSMLREVEESFKRVVGLGSLRSFEAMYKIAEAYEELANSISNQRLPENLSKEQRLVEEDQVFKASVPAYDRAVQEYKNVLLNLPVLAEKLEVSLDTTAVKPEVPEGEESDSALVVRKEVEADSSTQVALKWLGRSRERISLIQYGVAERASDFITEYLRVDNPARGVNSLVFTDQVLSTLVAPQVNTTIEAHIKNIKVAEELSLDNQYVEESKRKILLARNILAEEYARLARRSADFYLSSLPQMDTLLVRGETATTPDGMDYYDYQDTYLMQLIFYINRFAQVSLNQYKITLQLANENQINNDTRVTTEERLFNTGYELGELIATIAEEPAAKSEYYLTLFDSTENENYQLGSTFYDDQSFELGGYSIELYELAYDISKENEIENIWTQLILSKLVENDPATYLQDLPRKEMVIATDSTWRSTTLYDPIWNLREYSDTGWDRSKEVTMAPGAANRTLDSMQVSPAALWVSRVQLGGASARSSGNPLEFEDRSNVDSLLTDSSAAATLPAGPDGGLTGLSVEEPDTLTAYFRRTFQLDSDAIDGVIAITADEGFRLYINDVYIAGEEKTDFGSAQVVPFYTFSEFVKPGENLIALSVTDSAPPRNGVRFHLNVKMLPGDITDTVRNIRKRLEPKQVDPARLRETGVLNKNRIVD